MAGIHVIDYNDVYFNNCLSTGSKILLNIYRYPELCFNVMECGDNALELLAGIKKDNIL